MTFSNPLTDAWKSGRATVGAWCILPDAPAVEIIARQGLDYVCLDLQHGIIDHSSSIPMLQAITAAGCTPLVRVRWNEPAAIMSALDAGALGVVVPMIETPDDARRAVAACRYPPHGRRSYGPNRARDVIGSTDPDELGKVACIIMIETPKALENLDQIAATPGLDAIYIGPSDLALSLGEKPGTDAPILATTINKIHQTCRKHGVAAGMHTASGEVARRYLDDGFDFVTAFSDTALLTWAARQHLDAARPASSKAEAQSDQPGTD